MTGIPSEHGGGSHPIVTSSSSMPSLMLRMLEDLEIHDGHRVLEIGTGTGYNAALLCERLGDAHVTSIDIDPELVATAGRRLAAHGYRSQLVAGDGAAGVSEHAPYDRVIATCSVQRVPYAWVAQTRPGGRIMVNVRGPLMRSALALLTVHADGTASGPFLSEGAIFMPLRHDHRAPYDYTVRISPPGTDPTRGLTSLDPNSLHTHTAWGFSPKAAWPTPPSVSSLSTARKPAWEPRSPPRRAPGHSSATTAAAVATPPAKPGLAAWSTCSNTPTTDGTP